MNTGFALKTLRVSLLIIVFLICYFSSTAISNSPHIKNFDKHEYEAASQNWSTAIDQKGYVYFGNSMGLLEFDGVTWKLYPSPNGSIIRAVSVGNDNRIFTCGYRELGYWERDDIGTLKYHSLTSLAEEQFTFNEEFWNILIIGEKVYFHAFSGIFIYESGGFKVARPGGFVHFATRLGDNIFINIRDKGIYKLTGHTFSPFLESSFFNEKTIRFLFTMDQDNLLIGTESNGIFSYNRNTNEYIPWAPQLTSYFSQHKINRGIVLPDSTLIIGTILDGIIATDQKGNKLFHLNKEKGLQNNTVLGTAMDRFGNVWLALDKGIDFLSFPSSRAFSIVKQNELGALYTAARYNNQLYVGTNQGLFRRKWNETNLPFSLVPHTQEQVWDCKIIDNTLFTGHNSGTFLIKNDKIEKITNTPGGYSIIRNPLNPNILIQSTYLYLVVYSKEKGQWKLSHTIKGFNNLIRYLAFDHLNNLWASHLYQGIYKIRLNEKLDSVQSMKYYGKNSILGKEALNSHVFKVENRIVFTTGKKLYTYNDLNDSIIPYTTLNESLKDYSSSLLIVPAPDHRYWFINSQGIACFEIRLNTIKKIKEFPNSLFENQLIPGYENIIPLDEEQALVCLESGYAILNTASKDEGNEIAQQKLQLREIIISDRNENTEPISPSVAAVDLPFNKNNLLLRYSFPLYSGEKINYQYMIDGLTDKWSKPVNKPIFNIKRIPPGDYVINVKAINNWGKSSQVHRLKIEINPPWHQTKTAIFSYVLIFIFLSFIYRNTAINRIKKNEKRKREEKEKELIQVRNEKLQSELSFKSQELANSTMGIIKKNEFLMSLKEKLKRQKEQLGSRYPDKYYNDLLEKINDNITAQDDWKIFESNFEKAHHTFFKKLKSNFPDLTPSDLRLCSYLRMNLSSKEIAPLLGITVRGVENHRYRIRKKLKLDAEENLTEFILTM